MAYKTNCINRTSISSYPFNLFIHAVVGDFHILYWIKYYGVFPKYAVTVSIKKKKTEKNLWTITEQCAYKYAHPCLEVEFISQ